MIPSAFFCVMTVVSGISANRLRRYDNDYLEDGYLRPGMKYSPTMHSYQVGDGYNERYMNAGTDRYIARNLQKAPDSRRDDDDDQGGRSGAYKYGDSSWMGQHYPVKSSYSYIKPTPASSTTTPSCVTVSASTTLSRLVSICQLPTTYAYTGTVTDVTQYDAEGSAINTIQGVATLSLYSSETGSCTLVGVPSKLIPDCCNGPATASCYGPCVTTTVVRTILKDKTCTMRVETFYYRDAGQDWWDLEPTSGTDKFSIIKMATTCAL